MLLSKKFKEIQNKIVAILDPHYNRGLSIQTEVYELKDSIGKVIDHVAFDVSNQIVSVVFKDNSLWFDNQKIYGSYSKIKRDCVTGWCFDKYGYNIDGFNSDGYYAKAS